ncbi:hypothetical protein LK09_17730 [Microbacterium mangrovi]|uniref:Glycoside hydrolase family 43 n=1 Tax=Microbacterium mangrovi TaxID=1348253 RepID=A0A0B1ZXH8_9MICO|nr:hypothetical protein LK09_17730 [Microbacterium mangrovi]
MLACVVVLLGGCAGSRPGVGASPSGGSAASFVIDADFPDPDVLRTDVEYVAYATGTYGVNLQSATSPDLTSWTVSGEDPLPKLPAWASTGRTWAPDVSEIGGRTVMYFAAEHTGSGKQCIGVATSPSPTGAFTPAGGAPLVCPLAQGGAIDPSTFVDGDGSRYLLWKTDGNCCGLDTWIEIARLSDDGLSLVGPVHRLIDRSLPWEGNLVEAPTLVKHGGRYALFYSANDYSGDHYAIGVAWADSLFGPYRKQAQPVLSTALSHGRYRGPGGQDVVGDTLVFHSWDEQYIYRGMNTARITWGAKQVRAG